jgi:hypothetical protein
MKIKIKDKSFPTTSYGFLESGKEYDVSDSFAKYCVEKMKSAEYVAVKNTRKKVVKK